MKIIKISECTQCAHFDPCWSFNGNAGCIAGCEKTRLELKNPSVIPIFCPLPDAESPEYGPQTEVNK